MKVMMAPHPNIRGDGSESGIWRVVEAYHKYLPYYDIEVVDRFASSYDIAAIHAGLYNGPCDVAHTHGLYWTADYEAHRWEWATNARVIASVRYAKIVTVPSSWVAETFRRDMRLNPRILPHGIDWDDWQHNEVNGSYVLWNKNRSFDVCSPYPVGVLAQKFPKQKFVMTIAPEGHFPNIHETGVIAHHKMKKLIQSAALYLSTTKETFGIGTLEAMASGVPVLGFAHGGNLDLIKHKKTGYLAKVNDYEDLFEGLVYCVNNRDDLGYAAREDARNWSWEKTIEKLAEIYREAAKPEEPTVAIIIPSYNYAEKVGRAIESAIKQTYKKVARIVVVDDGSKDAEATRTIVKGFTTQDERVSYVYYENSGVAIARNRGISNVATKYVCCLDADDAIQPHFIEACVQALEEDRSLGIAYTGLWYINPDGKEGLSRWPGQFNYDKQLQRQNQIPTCCVFRREMWERLGGYKQRYAPEGAGSEDAEFWLRAGACGYGAKKVTDAGLFIYSWKSGRVSGDPKYREVDWLGWHPWTRDGKHPFASVASPKMFSHAVRQYDEPIISVIIPVGPGHEEMVRDALDSLEGQTFRKWEAIVVWDSPIDDFGPRAQTERAYPYVSWHYADLELRCPGESVGAGIARNLGAEFARAPFLLFLDADDWLYPDCLMQMMSAWEAENAIIYTDYVGKAIVDDPSKLAPNLQKTLYKYNEKTKEAIIGYRSADYDCERAQRQPERTKSPHMPYYLWCNVTALIPKEWHDEIGGFDENMKSWEDVDYHWRMARAGKCYVRIPEELMVYRFYTGTRRQTGLHDFESLIEYIKDKYKDIEIMGCGCGGNKQYRNPAVARSSTTLLSDQQREEMRLSDDDFVKVKYTHPNRGVHKVVGGVTKTMYGFRQGGSTFLVHKDDIAGFPHLFVPI